MVNIHIKITSDCVMQNQQCDWLCKNKFHLQEMNIKVNEMQGEADMHSTEMHLLTPVTVQTEVYYQI